MRKRFAYDRSLAEGLGVKWTLDVVVELPCSIMNLDVVVFSGLPFKAGDKFDVMSLHYDCTLNPGSPITKPYFIIDTVEIAGFFKTTAEVNLSHISKSMLESNKSGLSIKRRLKTYSFQLSYFS